MTLTLTNIPDHVERAIRQRAQQEGRTPDEVALRLLIEATGVRPESGSDFGDVAGTWVADPAVEQALRDQDDLDPDLWRRLAIAFR